MMDQNPKFFEKKGELNTPYIYDLYMWSNVYFNLACKRCEDFFFKLSKEHMHLCVMEMSQMILPSSIAIRFKCLSV